MQFQPMFVDFLDKLKTSKNVAVLEAVKKGYAVCCFEAVAMDKKKPCPHCVGSAHPYMVGDMKLPYIIKNGQPVPCPYCNGDGYVSDEAYNGSIETTGEGGGDTDIDLNKVGNDAAQIDGNDWSVYDAAEAIAKKSDGIISFAKYAISNTLLGDALRRQASTQGYNVNDVYGAIKAVKSENPEMVNRYISSYANTLANQMANKTGYSVEELLDAVKSYKTGATPDAVMAKQEEEKRKQADAANSTLQTNISKMRSRKAPAVAASGSSVGLDDLLASFGG